MDYKKKLKKDLIKLLEEKNDFITELRGEIKKKQDIEEILGETIQSEEKWMKRMDNNYNKLIKNIVGWKVFSIVLAILLVIFIII